jgi:hypothetical protein
MPSGDDLISHALTSDRYEVDTATGTVIGPRGRPLACPPDRDGYRTLTIVSPDGQGTVRLHRLVAAAVWGVDAIRGVQVGHRNGDKDDNGAGNLWLPSSAMEHYHHDERTSGPRYKGGAPARASWDPCVRCGAPDGPPHPGRKTGSPARVNGKKFEIDGELCWRCYRALHERERRRRKREGAYRSPT